MYEMAIFDLDGTVLDTTEGIITAVNHTIEVKNLKKLEYTDLLSFIGPPIQISFADTFNIMGEELEEAVRCFRDFYKKECLFLADIYNGIQNVFENLRMKDIKMAVATYKPELFAKKIFEHFLLRKYFQVISGSNFSNELKKTDIIEKCLKTVKIDKSNKVVMIGDSPQDAMAAEELGIDFIGVSYGYGFKNKEDALEYQCVGIVEKPIDLIDFFNSEK